MRFNNLSGMPMVPRHSGWRPAAREARCALLFFVVASAAAVAQMVEPAIDKPGEPFSYYSQPVDVIGVMDARSGTEVTPEGYLYTGSGELMFFAGDPEVPMQQRVKTLMRGYLPVVEYICQYQSISYQFSMFAATLDGRPEGTLVNFVRVTITNTASAQRLAHFSLGVRYQNQTNQSNGVGDNRFKRPAVAKRVGEYYQAGVEFNPKWTYGFDGDAFVRDGKVMYLFPDTPEPGMRLTLKEPYNFPPDLKTRELPVAPNTPVGIVHYKLPLAAGQQTQLIFKMPYTPLEASSPEVAKMRDAGFDAYLESTVKFWDDVLAKGIEISTPEQKLNDTFKANLIYDLIARDKVGDDYVQTVNKFHYHAFWLRDSSYIVRMYDVSGYHDYAAQDLKFFAGWQQPDGNFVSQGGQFDGWGQTMWAYGQHYSITHDKVFAQQVYPAVQHAVAWLQKARQGDPMHLMPVTSPGDNEELTGHVTGHNFWAMAGLKNAIVLAQGTGNATEAKAWQQEYDDFQATLVKVLEKVTSTTGGYIPPGLDGQHGQDWGNMLAVYPEPILQPSNPMVTATLQATRAKYAEGIMTYGDGSFLHHYLTMKNTETEIIRGEQQTALEELYALLVHTSSTHAGFEYAIHPWGTRDFGLNLSPHGWFAAKFRTVVRDMMVREDGSDLHVLSVVSPEWLQPGKGITVDRAPTNFGQVNFQVQVPAEGRSVIRFDNHFSQPPSRLVLHIPWWLEVNQAAIDGKVATVSGNELVLPVNVKEVTLQWSRHGDVPRMSYEQAVADYKAEYSRRYDDFLQKGDSKPLWLTKEKK